jgi:hypothetical protein
MKSSRRPPARRRRSARASRPGAEGDVLAHRAGEQEALLRDDPSWRRSDAWVTSRRSVPSIVIRPCVGS